MFVYDIFLLIKISETFNFFSAQAIQAASELYVRVALNAEYFCSYAGLYRMPMPPEDAVRALKDAGMRSENYVGLAHGVESVYILTQQKKY